MVSSYKGTENNEQPKRLILTANQTTTSYSKYYINGVFRNECAKIDYARRNGTLYRADGIYGELIAIAPEQIIDIIEGQENENQD